MFRLCLVLALGTLCASQYIQQQALNQDALILTPFIRNGSLKEAREAAQVDPTIFLGVNSSAGYLTVDAAFNSNLFFWFFPAAEDYENAPVVFWLEGGPGETAMYQLFCGNGPFQFSPLGELELREYSWHKNYSLLYIDNPTGTGWSFTDEGGYSQNQTKVGEDLYEALQQFFTLFEELQDKPFFLTGESYAGKYVPTLGHAIFKKNPTSDLKINLQGLAIGNGWTDPRNQLVVYGDFLYQIGLIDGNAKQVFDNTTAQVAAFIDNDQFTEANTLMRELFSPAAVGTFFYNISGIANVYNYLVAVDNDPSEDYMRAFMQTEPVRTALHVGNNTFHDGKTVYANLFDDVMRSVAPQLAELICNYRVLIYNGQLDIIVAYPFTVNFLQKLDFCGNDDYLTASRSIWTVDGDVAGYSKVAGNLTEVLVRNAGHIVLADQPKWGFDLISKFIANKPIV